MKHTLKPMLSIFFGVIWTIASCAPAGPDESGSDAALLLLLNADLLTASDSSSSSSTGTTCDGTPIADATFVSSTSSAAGTLSSSSAVDVYSFSAGTFSNYHLFVHSVATGTDVTMKICNSSGTLLQTVNNNGNGAAEGLSDVSFTAIASYYILVSGTAAGSYRVDIENSKFGSASVSGGGSCTGWDGTKCINFDSDFQNGSTFCTGIGGAYSATSCTTTSLQGRCTAYDGGTGSGGYLSILGFTGEYGTDTALQTYCTGVYAARYFYNSNSF